MMQCPECGSYLSSFLKYGFAHPIVGYKCSCGWSSIGKVIIDNKTYNYNFSTTNTSFNNEEKQEYKEEILSEIMMRVNDWCSNGRGIDNVIISDMCDDIRFDKNI